MIGADTPVKRFLLSFEGRFSRLDFWLFLGPVAIAHGLVDVISHAIGAENLLTIGFAAMVMWPFLAVLAKRWHDRDKSGWWSLIVFVPLIGTPWLLIECGFLPGTKGDNRFGPDPLPAEPATTSDLPERHRL